MSEADERPEDSHGPPTRRDILKKGAKLLLYVAPVVTTVLIGGKAEAHAPRPAKGTNSCPSGHFISRKKRRCQHPGDS